MGHDFKGVRKIDLAAAGVLGHPIFVTVRFTANVLDYGVDETSGEVVDGDRRRPVNFQEEWRFAQPVGGGPWKREGIAVMPSGSVSSTPDVSIPIAMPTPFSITRVALVANVIPNIFLPDAMADGRFQFFHGALRFAHLEIRNVEGLLLLLACFVTLPIGFLF
jgi:hypothetical protein